MHRPSLLTVTVRSATSARPRRGLAAAALALALGAAAGCSSGEPSAAPADPVTASAAPGAAGASGPTPTGTPKPEVVPDPAVVGEGDAPVLVPGRPGEPMVTATPGQTVLPGGPQWNDVDVVFATGMVPHHAQALEMAELAPGRAQDEQVRVLAERILASQAPEIRVLAQWLSDRGHEVPGEAAAAEGADEHGEHGEHGDHAEHEDPALHEDHSAHAGMAGMATPEQMAQLEAAQGAEFDRLFLELMQRHHEGALTMAAPVVERGSDPQLAEVAQDVATGQAAEIRRMQDIAASL